MQNESLMTNALKIVSDSEQRISPLIIVRPRRTKNISKSMCAESCGLDVTFWQRPFDGLWLKGMHAGVLAFWRTKKSHFRP